MKKVAKAVGVLIGIIFLLAIGINSCILVGQGPDRPSVGIVFYWLTK